MIGQANVTHVVVGKDLAIATSSQTRSDLSTGQIGVFLVGSTVGKTNALTAGDKFTIVYKRTDGALIESPVISYNNIVNKGAVTYSAATERIRVLGFNGTTGSIDVTNSEDYVVHYNWYDNSKTFGRGKPVKFVAYRSSAAATQVEIAGGLIANMIANNSKESSPIIVPTMLINNAGAAITGAPTSFTVVKGSKYVAWTGTDPSNISAGDYIRINGTAVTDPCYPVTAIDTTNNYLTLGYAYQGTSGTILNASMEIIAAATAATADAGVKFSGQVLPFSVGVKKYAKLEFIFWKVGEGFGSTTVTATSAPDKGKGTYYEIAEVEWFLRGNRGEPKRIADYPVNYTADATSGKTYSQIVVDFYDSNARTLDREVKSYETIMIATETDSSYTPHASLKTVLGIS